jgi:hypothetical protein
VKRGTESQCNYAVEALRRLAELSFCKRRVGLDLVVEAVTAGKALLDPEVLDALKYVARVGTSSQRREATQALSCMLEAETLPQTCWRWA